MNHNVNSENCPAHIYVVHVGGLPPSLCINAQILPLSDLMQHLPHPSHVHPHVPL